MGKLRPQSLSGLDILNHYLVIKIERFKKSMNYSIPRMDSIQADEIIRLVDEHKNADLFPSKKSELQETLDDIANRFNFEKDLEIVGENGAHRDDAIKELVGYGADSFTQYHFGEY